MTGLAEYTGDEWALLTRAPEIVGFGMLAVSGSGPIGKLREFHALRTCLQPRGIPAELGRYQIIRAVLANMRTPSYEPFALLSTGVELIELLATLLAPQPYIREYSERIATLLEHTVPHEEADGFKRWLMWIARRVAAASGAGWLGTGTRISDNENGMLNLLAESLHLVTAADGATTVEADILPYTSTEPADRVVDSGDGTDSPTSLE